MIIYIDNDNKCYVSPAEDRREVDAPFFEGKCAEFIEGYRHVPAGETWIREDGAEFVGTMTFPWKPYFELYKAQLEYELAQLKAENVEYESVLTEIENALSTE